MTLQDFLNGFANGSKLDLWSEHLLTQEVRRVWFCIDDDSRMRSSCGGQSVVGIEWEVEASGLQNRPAYIVVDDSEGNAWDAQKSRGEQPTQHARPFATLRLVQSA